MVKMETWAKVGGVLLVAAALVVGCETSSLNNEGTLTLAELQGITPTPTPTPDTSTPDTSTPDTSTPTTPDTGTSTNGMWPAEITGPIKWLNTDVSGWAETASLTARVGGGTISMPYSKAKVWPSQGGVNANCWAIVNIGGIWYAATFEYLRAGQTSKPMSVLSKTDGKGDHFKVSPLSSWAPSHGERFGIMVSGLMRGSARNVKERSNISMVTWP